MFTKLLLVLAAVCVVNSSAFTDNVFNENDPETEVASNPRQCIPSNCKQQCRRQGFANGYCVAGQCRCTALKTQEYPEQNPSYLEDSVSITENDPEIEIASNPRQCIPSNCKQQCRRQGFANGYCVAGQCRCTALKAQENDPENEVASNPRQCIPSNCKQQCRRQGFANGYCVAGQCRCTALKAQDNDPETEIARNPLKCDDAACRRKCRDKGFAQGGCYLGRCKCRR